MAAKKAKKKIETTNASILNATIPIIKKSETPDKTKKQAKTKKVKPGKASAPKKENTGLKKTDNSYIVIDYPTEGETISGLMYTIRIGASEKNNVEISINNGEWQPARNSSGYWWFDWGYFTAGKNKIAARLIDNSGKTIKTTEQRKVIIK